VSLDTKTSMKKTEISYEELSKLVDAGTLQLYDVREPADVNQTGVIYSAINIPCMIDMYFLLLFRSTLLSRPNKVSQMSIHPYIRPSIHKKVI